MADLQPCRYPNIEDTNVDQGYENGGADHDHLRMFSVCDDNSNTVDDNL